MARVRDEGLCVRQWDWSETSQTVSLFGRETGLIRALAKGSRRENASFSGGLDVVTRGEFEAITKPAGQLATLTSWDLVETFPRVRRSLRPFGASMVVMEVVLTTAPEGDARHGLYDASVRALRDIDGGIDPDRCVLAMLWAGLSEGGYKPELVLDARTGAALPDREVHTFDPEAGGLVTSTRTLAWKVRRTTVELLRDVDGGRAPEDLEPGEDGVLRACRLLAAFSEHILGRELPALRGFLESGG